MVERAYFCWPEVIGRDQTLVETTGSIKSLVGAVARERSAGGWKEWKAGRGANKLATTGFIAATRHDRGWQMGGKGI